MAECSWGEREARAGGWDVQTGREEQEQKPRAAEAEGDTQAWPLAATNWKLTVERSRTHGPMRGTSSARPQAYRNLNYVSLKHTRCSGPLRSVGLAPWPHLGLGPPSFSTTPLQTFRWHWGDYQQLRMSVLSRMLTSEHRSKTYKLKGIFLKCQWVQPISVAVTFLWRVQRPLKHHLWLKTCLTISATFPAPLWGPAPPSSWVHFTSPGAQTTAGPVNSISAAPQM